MAQKAFDFMTAYKIGIFGNGGVGKTCITMQFVRKEFTDGYIPTIEDEEAKTINIDNQTIKLDIIDTAGQDDFAEMRHRYIQIVDGFVFVYSLEEPKSIEQIREMYNDTVASTGKKNIICIIAANKVDLISDLANNYAFEQGKELAQQLNCQILDTSAKTGHNINQLFEDITRTLMSKKKTGHKESDPQQSKGCCEVY